jgi:hypothetical protein
MNRRLSELWRAFRGEFPTPIGKLLRDLIWPAAAGNVAWSFLQLLFVPPKCNRWPYLTLLPLMAIYLAIDWLRSASEETRDWKYWVADLCLVSGIVVLAIAAQANQSVLFLHVTLGSVFGAAAGLHLIGAWEGKREKEWSLERKVCTRRWMAACGALGLVILLCSAFLYRRAMPSTLPISFGTVLVAWFVARTLLSGHAEAEVPPENVR